MSYLIRNNEVVAETSETYKSGAIVEYSHDVVEEKINAAREYNLLNARTAKISNAEKWGKGSQLYSQRRLAKAINDSDDEFLVL